MRRKDIVVQLNICVELERIGVHSILYEYVESALVGTVDIGIMPRPPGSRKTSGNWRYD
jgi:hypothetical protein